MYHAAACMFQARSAGWDSRRIRLGLRELMAHSKGERFKTYPTTLNGKGKMIDSKLPLLGGDMWSFPGGDMLVISCSKFYVRPSLAWFLTSAFSGEFGFFLRFQDHWISFVGLVYHRIHVWYIHLHLVDVYGKCRYINIPYMDPMGNYIILIRARLCLANMCWRHVWIGSLQRGKTAAWWRFSSPGTASYDVQIISLSLRPCTANLPKRRGRCLPSL